VLIMVAVFLSIKLLKRIKETGSKKSFKEKKEEIPCQGKDSAFYRIENSLKCSALSRYDWETLQDWLARVEKEAVLLPHIEDMKKIISCHYRYRFDPAGISDKERVWLESKVRSLLQNFKDKL